MFEYFSTGRDPKERRSVPRITALAVSLVLHFFFVLWLANFHWHVKIFDLGKENVRNVILGPSLKYPLPRIVGRAQEEPEREAGEPGKGGGAAGKVTGTPGSGGTGTAGGLEEGQPGPVNEGVIRSMADAFHKSLVAARKPGGTGLSVVLGGPGGGAAAPAAKGPLRVPDLVSGMPGPGIGKGSGIGPGLGGLKWTGRKSRGPKSQVLGVSVPSHGIDLAPWAMKVAESIQKNWDLPRIGKFPSPVKVSFIVLVKKSGEMDSMEIVEVTSIESLDQAAVASIRASLPFPALPDNFPGDLLEITFEFAYHD